MGGAAFGDAEDEFVVVAGCAAVVVAGGGGGGREVKVGFADAESVDDGDWVGLDGRLRHQEIAPAAEATAGEVEG